TFVMRDRRHHGALRIDDGLIVLEQLHFADEVRPAAELKPRKQKVSKQELAMAAKLIDSYKGAWRPAKYKDTYRDELLALIKSKRSGTKLPEPPAPRDEAPDLMEALRESLKAGRASTPRRASKPKRAAARGKSRKRAAR
ncbi:MAG TPA: Ku protein, partial [Gaiellaceae bacterium]